MSRVQRPTSAGYRMPLGNTTSAHREISKSEAAPTVAELRIAKKAEKCNMVAQSKIWREQVHSEWKAVKEWDKNYGFMKDFDPRGRPITPEELSEENQSYFNETVSPTQGHVYGSRVATELGEKMSEMEFLFNSSNRKCKMDSEFTCS